MLGHAFFFLESRSGERYWPSEESTGITVFLWVPLSGRESGKACGGLVIGCFADYSFHSGGNFLKKASCGHEATKVIAPDDESAPVVVVVAVVARACVRYPCTRAWELGSLPVSESNAVEAGKLSGLP